MTATSERTNDAGDDALVGAGTQGGDAASHRAECLRRRYVPWRFGPVHMHNELGCRLTVVPERALQS